jgi:hypothetical protein
MTYAKLTLTVPDDVWISELSRSYPETRFRVLAATATDATGHARIEILGPEAPSVCEGIQSYETVSDLTVFEADSERRRVQVETTVPILLNAVQAAGIPLDMPVEISDGKLTLELTVPSEKLSALGDTLKEFGISYTVDCIQQETESDDLLTERQQWLLQEAVDRGYYDTPRRTTLVELAEEMDIAKSTCSEILHRAEEQVLKRFLDGDCEHQPDIAVRAD